MSDERYPIADLTAAVPELKRPFTVAAVRLKPQTVTQDKTKGLVTYYIDARLVVERLNAVVGAGAWSDSYRPLNVGMEALAVGIPVECALEVLGVVKTDVGQIAPGEKDDKMWKSAYSDAFKRAAVKFGVGAYLYGGAQVWAAVKVGNNGKVQGFSPEGIAHAKREYVKWVNSLAPLWGQPLDHGDIEHDHVDLDTAGGTGEAQVEVDPYAIDPGVQLLDGAVLGEQAGAAGAEKMKAADPTVEWSEMIAQACASHFGKPRADLSDGERDEFWRRFANLAERVRRQTDANTIPPITDDEIVASVAWAFAGAAVKLTRKGQQA